jgi:hypothetical protein
MVVQVVVVLVQREQVVLAIPQILHHRKAIMGEMEQIQLLLAAVVEAEHQPLVEPNLELLLVLAVMALLRLYLVRL